MFFVAHKAAFSEVFVSEKERVEMNAFIAICAIIGFVVGVFLVGSPSIDARTDGLMGFYS